MPAKNEQYRLKAIKGAWYTVKEVYKTTVVLEDSNGHLQSISKNTLQKNYTKEK